MVKLYEVVFYSGEEPFPAYYLIDNIRCENVEDELRNRLSLITQRVRKMFGIEDGIPNWRIHEALYVLQEDGLIAVKNIA
ncbi:MAG: hypothetical protein IMY77_02400 [Chloroflexi bacterium]|nr:hypothetical protein [Chloroflexota bacterium]